MEDLPSEIVSLPRIVFLPARLDGESTDVNRLEELKAASPIRKYGELEDLVYGHFARNKSKFLLHFHTDRLEQCGSKLRPLSFDQGRYFHDDVLEDGALHLVPHFVTIKEGVRKRIMLRDTDDGLPSARLQKRRNETITPPEPKCMNTDSENAPASSPETIGEQEASEDKTKSRIQAHIGFDHGTFRRCATSRLPPGVTCSSFMTDFEAEKQRYILSRGLSAYSTLSRSQKGLVCLHAHVVMIRGKYGMDASMPCDLCVKDGLVCRVYHSSCFEWDVAGKDAYFSLGWRCEQCRTKRSMHRDGGCNAQHAH